MGRGGGCRGLVGVWEQCVGCGPSGEQVGVCVVADGVGGILLLGSLREGRGLPTREGTGEALTDSRARERENGEREKGKV